MGAGSKKGKKGQKGPRVAKKRTAKDTDSVFSEERDRRGGRQGVQAVQAEDHQGESEQHGPGHVQGVEPLQDTRAPDQREIARPETGRGHE